MDWLQSVWASVNPPGPWMSWLATMALALATFFACLVALFGQQFRDKHFPPLLGVELLSSDGEKTNATIQGPAKDQQARTLLRVPARYYHLRARNSRRRVKATDVQLMLLRVDEPAADGKLQPVWRGAVPLRWRHQSLYPTLRSIGADADAELFAVLQDNGLQLCVLASPDNLEAQKRGACTMVLHIEGRSNEVTTPIIRIKIAWDGKWADGSQEMRKHCVVEVLDEKDMTWSTALE
jgi:hypothetical protein